MTTVQLGQEPGRNTLEALQEAASIQGLTFGRLGAEAHRAQGVLHLTLNDQLAIARAILSGEIEKPSPHERRSPHVAGA